MFDRSCRPELQPMVQIVNNVWCVLDMRTLFDVSMHMLPHLHRTYVQIRVSAYVDVKYVTSLSMWLCWRVLGAYCTTSIVCLCRRPGHEQLSVALEQHLRLFWPWPWRFIANVIASYIQYWGNDGNYCVPVSKCVPIVPTRHMHAVLSSHLATQ